MHSNQLLMLFFLILMSCHRVARANFITWLFSDPDSNSRLAGEREDSQEERQATPAASSVPFEMTIGDEKFQLQAQFVKDLSPLDYCHHKVIHNLHDSCGDMTEEQLGKLAVHLLNCQLNAEKRETYQCDQEMSLAECTGSMDGTVWNAYQIVSNRARAVCYTARQQQFRMRTEMTVNTLVQTAESQLLSMLRMEETQQELKSVTLDTIEEVQQGQERIVAAHGHLQKSQAQISSSMASNMYALMREKALIASGNQELTEMTEAIKNKLDQTSEQIVHQGSQQKTNHEELLHDLDAIRQRAIEVWEKIDASTQDVLNYQEKTRQHYTETLDNLSRINSTIANVYSAIMQQKETLERFIDWVVGFLGGTGDSIAILQVFFMHVGYLLLSAISASFLQTPIFTRVILLIIVPMNALAELRGDEVQSLSFSAMTSLIVLTTFGNWSICFGYCMWTWWNRAKSPPQCVCSSYPMQAISDGSMTSHSNSPVVNNASPLVSQYNSPDVRKLLKVLEKMYESGTLSPPNNNTEHDTDSHGSQTHPSQVYEVISTPSQAKRDLMVSLEDSTTNSQVDYFHPSTPLRSEKRSATPVNGSPRFRPLCLSTTKNNRPCKLPSVDGSAFCYKHRV